MHVCDLSRGRGEYCSRPPGIVRLLYQAWPGGLYFLFGSMTSSSWPLAMMPPGQGLMYLIVLSKDVSWSACPPLEPYSSESHGVFREKQLSIYSQMTPPVLPPEFQNTWAIHFLPETGFVLQAQRGQQMLGPTLF